MLRTIEIKNEKVSEHVELIYKNLTGAIKYDLFEKRPESPFSISEVNTILVANKAYHVWKRNHITPDFDDKVSFLFHACFEYLGDFLDSKIHIDGSVNWDDYDLVSPHQHLDSQYGLHKTIEHMLQNQVVDALKAKRLHKSLDTNSDPDFDLSNSVEKECGYDIETIKRFMAIL